MEQDKPEVISLEEETVQHIKLEAKDIKILDLGMTGLEPNEIAQITGDPETAIAYKLQTFKKAFKHLDKVKEFRADRADLLAAAQAAGLEAAFSGRKLQRASFLATLTGVEKLHKMERLEADKSTENVSHRHKVFGKIEVGNRAALENIPIPAEGINGPAKPS